MMYLKGSQEIEDLLVHKSKCIAVNMYNFILTQNMYNFILTQGCYSSVLVG